MIENARLVDAPAPRTLSRSVGSLEVLAIALLLGAVACSEPDPRPMNELVRQGDVFLDPQTLEPYSGPVFSTFDDAPLVIEARLSLRDGAYDGPYEAYFGNRQLSSREAYQNGRKHGPYEWYFDSGRLFEKGSYLMGILEGPYEAFWESGDLYEKGTYRAGEFDGARAWYLNGDLIELVTYLGGVIHGPYERYDVDGTLDLSGTLRGGAPCGRWLEGSVTITYPPCDESTE